MSSTAGPTEQPGTGQPISLRDRLAGWREIMQTANPPAERPLDTLGTWLVMTRAAVFPMTLWSGDQLGGRRAGHSRHRHRPGWVGPWVLLAVLAVPELLRALRFYNAPKPEAPPAWYPPRGWPLWFVGFAFRHTRLAGGLLTLGLLLNVVLPVQLPWV